jgi:hypothetical protein
MVTPGRKCQPVGARTDDVPNQEALAMDTLLVATQIICYGVGIVSASLNIASFVHRRVKSRRMQAVDAAKG